MSESYNPPTRAEAFVIGVALEDMANPGSFKANPTITAGDFKVSKDFGAFANLATLPTVEPAAGTQVKITLSIAEMTADVVYVQCVDATVPPEWASFAFAIPTVAA